MSRQSEARVRQLRRLETESYPDKKRSVDTDSGLFISTVDPAASAQSARESNVSAYDKIPLEIHIVLESEVSLPPACEAQDQ